MTEELDEYPSAFADSDIYPWEVEPEGDRWPWGADKGRLLQEIPTKGLLRHRAWLEGYVRWITAIDAILTERQGE